MKRLALALSVLLLFSTCAAYKAQHAAPAAPSAGFAKTEESHDAHAGHDMQPAAAPASSADPLLMRQAQLLSELDKFQDELKAEGRYDCCVTPACRQCAMTAGECHCRASIGKNGPCCGECTQSWIEGKGNVPGVDREQVLAHLGCVRELYEKKVPEGMEAPGTRKDE
jgi:hypothetical protein